MDDDGPKFSKLGMHAVMIFTMHDSLQVPSDSVSTPHHFFNSLIFSATFRFSSILIWVFNALTSAEYFFLPLFFTGAGKLGLDTCMQLWIFVSKIFSAMTMAMSIYRTLCVLVLRLSKVWRQGSFAILRYFYHKMASELSKLAS